MDNENKCNISKYSKPVQEYLLRAIEFQQNMYELSSDWNYYEESELEYLKKNITYSICGELEVENFQKDVSKTSSDQENYEREKKVAKLKKQIELIYQQILNASRTKKSLYVGVIFNVLCETNKIDRKGGKDKKDENDKKDETDEEVEKDRKNKKDKEDETNESFGTVLPIFKVRRCMDREEVQKCVKNDSTKCKGIGQTALYPYCVYYVDSGGRTYVNWTDYVTNNTLHECIMVLPMGGFYQANPDANNKDDKTYAWIEIGPSPAATRILTYVDAASTVLGLGALGVGIATLAVPVIAPVAMAGTVCGAITGLYTTVRSGHQLIDRHTHQQSISVTDKSARSAWFGVIGGVAGGAASGSSFILTKAVRAGATVGNVGKAAFNTITIGNIVINGAGIGNGVWGIIENFQENKEFSILEIGQVMAHIFFFGNAVMNFQTAKTVINNTQQQVLQDFESSLRSNRHKKAFKKIRRNTQAANGDTITADSEIIRGIRAIQNKDDFLAGIVRNRKVFASSKAKITFKDGYAMINDNVKFDPVEFAQQPKSDRVSIVSAAEPFIAARTSALPQSSKMLISDLFEQSYAIRQILEPIISIGGFALLKDGSKYILRLILDMQGFTKKDCQKLIVKLAELALRVVKQSRRDITRKLDELMLCIWDLFVKPEVDNVLQAMGIDLSAMVKSSGFAELLYDITRKLIDEMYDAIEGILEDIIEFFLQCAAAQSAIVSATCSVCSGDTLSDQ